MDKHIATEVRAECSVCGNELNESYIVPNYNTKITSFLYQNIRSQGNFYLYWEYKKNSNTFIYQIFSDTKTLCFECNLTQEKYNTFKRKINDVPK